MLTVCVMRGLYEDCCICTPLELSDTLRQARQERMLVVTIYTASSPTEEGQKSPQTQCTYIDPWTPRCEPSPSSDPKINNNKQHTRWLSYSPPPPPCRKHRAFGSSRIRADQHSSSSCSCILSLLQPRHGLMDDTTASEAVRVQ